MILENHAKYVDNKPPPQQPGQSADGDSLADQHDYNDLASSLINDTESYMYELIDEVEHHSMSHYEEMAVNFWPNFLAE